MLRSPWIAILFVCLALVAVTALAPLERTLGGNARLVYFHGAWVWTALVVLVSAGLLGAAGLVSGRARLHELAQAAARTGLLFWVIFLLMSLQLMQANWNGLFLDEPRFRIPFNLAVVGLLLQGGLALLGRPALSSAAYAAFAVALVASMGGVQTVLHPEAPIAQSGSDTIRLFFFLLLGLQLLLAALIGRQWLPQALPLDPTP
jgi:hypothetical protein